MRSCVGYYSSKNEQRCGGRRGFWVWSDSVRSQRGRSSGSKGKMTKDEVAE